MDAPQTITVTVQIGGAVPSSVDVCVAPGGTVSIPFTLGSTSCPLFFTACLQGEITTQDGANWLSLALGLLSPVVLSFAKPSAARVGAFAGNQSPPVVKSP